MITGNAKSCYVPALVLILIFLLSLPLSLASLHLGPMIGIQIIDR